MRAYLRRSGVSADTQVAAADGRASPPWDTSGLEEMPRMFPLSERQKTLLVFKSATSSVTKVHAIGKKLPFLMV